MWTGIPIGSWLPGIASAFATQAWLQLGRSPPSSTTRLLSCSSPVIPVSKLKVMFWGITASSGQKVPKRTQKKRTKIILELLSPWKTDMVYILIPWNNALYLYTYACHMMFICVPIFAGHVNTCWYSRASMIHDQNPFEGKLLELLPQLRGRLVGRSIAKPLWPGRNCEGGPTTWHWIYMGLQHPCSGWFYLYCIVCDDLGHEVPLNLWICPAGILIRLDALLGSKVGELTAS
jgi:hypothetical protein